MLTQVELPPRSLEDCRSVLGDGALHELTEDHEGSRERRVAAREPMGRDGPSPWRLATSLRLLGQLQG